MIVVFSRPGREQLTAATVEALEGHGGGSQLHHESKCLFWVGETPPPVVPWRCVAFPQKPGGSVTDFWLLLRTFPDRDLVVVEDDIEPCRNALPYIDRWNDARFTSFCNGRDFSPGPRAVDRFEFSQAIKVPRALAGRLRAHDPTTIPYRDYDLVIGAFLKRWGEEIYYHRSLVRHLGEPSVSRPEIGRRIYPQCRDFIRDFDALALVG